MVKMNLRNMIETDKSTYLSKIYEAENDYGKKVIVKKNNSKLSETYTNMLNTLIENPHPNLLIPIEIDTKQEGTIVEIYEYVDWPILDMMLYTVFSTGGNPLKGKIGYKWDTKTILSIMEQLTSALGHIHHLGFVHHDVRAKNIFIDRQLPRIKLFDYNISKKPYFLEEGESSWNDVPPEYRKGDSMIDFRYDVYQIGSVFSKLIRENPLIDGSQVVVELPKEVHDIIGKAISEDKLERYTDCNEMYVALKEIKRVA
ncbi:MAG: protein kinase [Candidatus Aenigmarchaeota archaeon]|nr:protein kinase [Candidatus Aenigmarchaeota archaeon]